MDRHGERVPARDKRRPVTELEAENSKLKRELAEMKMERDLLKKATAYFAKEWKLRNAFRLPARRSSAAATATTR